MIFQKNRIRRFERFFPEVHSCFFGHVVTFPGVALLARSYQVSPRIDAASCARDDMVDRKILPRSAVLALIAVALEDILPGKINALVRGVNISVQADDRRHGEALRDRPQFVAVGRPNELALFKINENEGPLH